MYLTSDSHPFRQTKIVATIGPATDSEENLEKLIVAGVNVIRLNMAHATPEWCDERIQRVRKIQDKLSRSVSVMMDVKGPEIRTGKVDEPIHVEPGEMFQFYIKTAEPPSDGMKAVTVNYPDLPKDVVIGYTVLVDSGLIRMEVVEKDEERVICKVLVGGEIGSKRHINLPGAKVNLPALTKKDKTDLKAGIESGIDFVALSFVREAKDIRELRDFLSDHGSNARIIAKIEDHNGVNNMMDIVRATDAIMVARGDLGIEIDYHQLPIVQRQLVEACRLHGKPVIIATHLLESMIDSPVPTRAEISDVSNAVREQADAVMLSGETTTGEFPLEAVKVMRTIIESIEPVVPYDLNDEIRLHEPKSKMLRSAAVLAQELGDDSGIVVFTRSGFLGYVLGAMRAKGVPIFAFTDKKSIYHQLTLPWGIDPFYQEFSDVDPEWTIQQALATLRDKNYRKSGSTVIVITNVIAGSKIIDSMQLREIP